MPTSSKRGEEKNSPRGKSWGAKVSGRERGGKKGGVAALGGGVCKISKCQETIKVGFGRR